MANFDLPIQRWLKIALVNLLIVATLGVILRYKILYPLPFVHQKHLLHAHSHFAFTGWITQVLMTLMAAYLVTANPAAGKKYHYLLLSNLITAYGMLVFFPIEGYGPYAIIFSTASIVVSYLFAFNFWRDLNRINKQSPAHGWFKAAVFFNAFSSLGAFALTAMMIGKVIHQNWYLAAEYFFLHFQYNGWFFFGAMGLLSALISRFGISDQNQKKIYRLFLFASVPAYFLSTLWMPLPVWVYVLVVASAFAQVLGLWWLFLAIKKHWVKIKVSFSKTTMYILGLSALALSIKLMLQLGSTVPALSKLAFGFRPIVIGYLHLVLLGVITLFLLGYLFSQSGITLTKFSRTGLVIFAAAVICNEILLMVQGVAAISYNIVPRINEMLFVTALLLFTGALLMTFAKRKRSER